MLRTPASLLASLLLLSSATLATSETLPTFQMTSLSNHTVQLPDAASGRVAILITGFTQSSSKASSAWHQKIALEIGQNPRFVIYDIAILGDVPRLFRSLVLGSFRKSIPTKLQDTFLITFENENGWKRVVGYSEKDDAYVMIVGAHGGILWQTHGLTADPYMATLRDRLYNSLPEAH